MTIIITADLDSSGEEEETDTNAPTLVSAEVKTSNTVNVVFSEDINGSTLNTSGNEFTISGHTITEANESSAGVITLTLSTTIGAGEVLSVTFNSDNFKDLADNQAVSPATVSITNNL